MPFSHMPCVETCLVRTNMSRRPSWGPGTAATDKTAECASCSKGRYSGAFANECTTCSAGQYQPTIGSASCTPCTGTNGNDFTNDTYSPVGRDTCWDCKQVHDANHKANGNHDGCGECDAGEYLNTGTASCVPCQPCSAEVPCLYYACRAVLASPPCCASHIM